MRLSRRTRRIVLLTTLLVLSVVLFLIVGVRLTRSALEMRNQRRVQAGEMLGVRPWMTVPYIARTYHLPEDQIFQALNLNDTRRNRRTPLSVLAARDRRDLDADIATINALIDRRQSPRPPPTPSRAP